MAIMSGFGAPFVGSDAVGSSQVRWKTTSLSVYTARTVTMSIDGIEVPGIGDDLADERHVRAGPLRPELGVGIRRHVPGDGVDRDEGRPVQAAPGPSDRT